MDHLATPPKSDPAGKVFAALLLLAAAVASAAMTPEITARNPLFGWAPLDWLFTFFMGWAIASIVFLPFMLLLLPFYLPIGLLLNRLLKTRA